MITTADVKTLLAATLRLAGGSADLIAPWDEIATRSLADANRDVNAILAARGLTAAQTATWAGLDATVLQQSVFWALSHGGAMLPAPVNTKEIESLDQRQALLAMTLVDGAGVVLVPDPGSRLVGHGSVTGAWADVSSKDPERPLGPFLDRGGRMRRW